MPAIDQCEPAIIAALQKDGWQIISRPCRIEMGEGYVYADLKAWRDEEIIVVEVKCFPDSSSQLDELYRALGQYLIYYEGLKKDSLEDALYLAVPLPIYETLLQISTVKAAVMRVKMIVCDIEQEAITQWIP